MTNPYKVLGVAENADMDEIKKQYRKLSRQYHPDANINNPNKDQAEEKFKEVQAAYDQIVKDRENGYTGGYDDYGRQNGYGQGSSGGYSGFGGFGGFGGNGAGSTWESSDAPYLRAARNYVDTGYYKEALSALANVPAGERTAEWYYISAIANYQMGSNATALEHAKTSITMEPDNPEYSEFYNTVVNGGQWYGARSGRYSTGGLDLDPCMWCLLCNCCCPMI